MIHAKKICKRCGVEYEDNDYPVCDYCLMVLDNYE
jgi:hypothetical protein